MSEHTIPQVDQTFEATPSDKLRWGVKDADPNGETVEFRGVDIHSDNMNVVIGGPQRRIPGRATLHFAQIDSAASELEHTESPYTADLADSNTLDQPYEIRRDAGGNLIAQPAARRRESSDDRTLPNTTSDRQGSENTSETYVFKKGPDGKRVAIPLDKYLEQKALKKAVSTGQEKATDNNEAEDDAVRNKEASERQALESHRVELELALQLVREQIKAAQDNVVGDKTNFHMAAVNLGHALNYGETDRRTSEVYYNLYSREADKLHPEDKGARLQQYTDLLRAQSKLFEELREIKASI